MRMKFLLIPILLILLTTGCNSNQNTIYIYTDNAEGLTANVKVLCKGVEIGLVNNVRLFGKGVLITLEIDEGIKIPKNAQLLIGTKNLAEMVIDIDYKWASKKSVQMGDTLQLNIGHESVRISDGYKMPGRALHTLRE